MEGFSVPYALVIFFITIAADIAYVYYVRRIMEGRALHAAATGALISLIGAVMVVSYTANRLYIAPLVFGTLIGTYIAVKFDAKHTRFRK